MHGVSSDTLVRLASGLDARCVKKQCGLVGLSMAFDLCLSQARTGVVAMRQDSNYLGRKGGKIERKKSEFVEFISFLKWLDLEIYG
jgi:hypothetical protein